MMTMLRPADVFASVTLVHMFLAITKGVPRALARSRPIGDVSAA